MSTQNKKDRADDSKRVPKSQKYYRIIALLMAVLMLSGMLFYTILQMIVAANAISSDSGQMIAVGLMYGSDVTVGFQTDTPNGFTVGSAVIKRGERTFTPLWILENTRVSVACDRNLVKEGTAYKIATGTKVTVGGYHLQLDAIPADREEAIQLVESVNTYLDGTDYYAIPSYIDGSYRVRVGHFASEEAANSAADTLPDLTSEYPLSVVSPANAGVAVLDPNNNRILFEYDCGEASNIGLEPVQTGSQKVYTKTPAQRIYDGVFVYRRYTTSTVDGVSVINLLPLEEYVAGVIPWEISPSWHHETQKVFAIAARTFALQGLYRHEAYGFDLCNQPHCQAYLGCGTANDNVYSAIAETEGMVLAYNNRLASIFYSSSAGGETITANHAWVSNPGPYIVSQPTPWEKYSIRYNGIWIEEVSPTELRDYLYNTKGYSNLKGASIDSIIIEEYAGQTGYVYTITFKDSLGNTKTVNKSDNIRSVLARYVKSSNFVVGKGSVTRTYDNVNQVSVTPVDTTPPPTLYDKITSKAADVLNQFNKMFNLTGSGIQSALPDNTATKKAATGGDAGELRLMMEDGQYNVSIDKTTVTETITASKSGNFIFAGRGYGHGVGISQWGALDLAEAGASAEFILNTYFPGIQIMPLDELK
ncbi:MAG: SpoIID/LytB domain-containing protein [Clostridiales bacterium]|nr:SpoIID/LytB domain-containing protein [Clostridiales bacterium]